jgi:hypothetical protein
VGPTGRPAGRPRVPRRGPRPRRLHAAALLGRDRGELPAPHGRRLSLGPGPARGPARIRRPVGEPVRRDGTLPRSRPVVAGERHYAGRDGRAESGHLFAERGRRSGTTRPDRRGVPVADRGRGHLAADRLPPRADGQPGGPGRPDARPGQCPRHAPGPAGTGAARPRTGGPQRPRPEPQ